MSYRLITGTSSSATLNLCSAVLRTAAVAGLTVIALEKLRECCPAWQGVSAELALAAPTLLAVGGTVALTTFFWKGQPNRVQLSLFIGLSAGIAFGAAHFTRRLTGFYLPYFESLRGSIDLVPPAGPWEGRAISQAIRALVLAKLSPYSLSAIAGLTLLTPISVRHTVPV